MTHKKSAPTDTADREIVVSRVFNAPRERVFDAWIDPKHIAHWWGPKGFTTTTISMDARPGGMWRYVMHGPDGTDYNNNKIVYIEIAKPERLVYATSADQEGDPHKFQTTVIFTAQGARTHLTMHMLFASAAERNTAVETFGAIQGANQTLDRLEALITD